MKVILVKAKHRGSAIVIFEDIAHVERASDLCLVLVVQKIEARLH
jgi:hypothetical protein